MNISKKTKYKKGEWNLFYMVLPFMVLIFMISYVPIFGWIIGFYDFRPGISLIENEFIGLKYFESVFRDKDVLRSLKNTLIFSGVNFVLTPLPMIFAVCLESQFLMVDTDLQFLEIWV